MDLLAARPADMPQLLPALLSIGTQPHCYNKAPPQGLAPFLVAAVGLIGLNLAAVLQ